MGNLGWTEILIILGIALIIFGPRKLPQIGKTIGESLAQFRRASEDFKRTWEMEVEEDDRKKRIASQVTDLPPATEEYGNPVDLPELYESALASGADETPQGENLVETTDTPTEQMVTEQEPAVAETK